MRKNICEEEKRCESEYSQQIMHWSFVLLSAIGAFAKDHKPLPFSADSKLTKTGSQEIMSRKLYMAWLKVRMDAKDSGFYALWGSEK